MNKSVMALLLSASMATGAHAALGNWTENSTGGDINAGGTVTVKDAAVWMWALGTVDTLDGLASDMTNDGTGKLLTFTAAADIPLLAGKTKAAYLKDAYTVRIPSVVLSSGGNTITPVFDADGAMSIPVPVVNADDNSSVGTFTINAKTAAMAAMQLADDTANFYPVISPAGSALEGINAPDAQAAYGHTSMLSYLAAMGSMTKAEMETEFTKLLPGVTPGLSDTAQTFSASSTQKAAVFSYAMGVPGGNTMTLKTDAALTDNVTWKAPLNIAISYN